MCYGVRGHQEFEPEQSRQKMLSNVTRPSAGVAVELFVNLVDDRIEEGACSGSRIEDLQPVGFVAFDALVGSLSLSLAWRLRSLERDLLGVGQAFGHHEILPQKGVYASHD